MKLSSRARRALLRILIVVGIPLLAYLIWNPGEWKSGGRFNRDRNGVWCSQGWVGNADWFSRTGRNPADFGEDSLRALRDRLRANGIAYVFPHLCPSTATGSLPAYDPRRMDQFVETLDGMTVIPWIGGVLGDGCLPENEAWRKSFCAQVAGLLERHPRLGGIHLNIEPMPDGTEGFLKLLEELKAVVGKERILSVAAYPPPTLWHPHPEVHWSEPYFRAVARRVDQVVPMMYDTSIQLEKVYVNLVRSWTIETLDWSEQAEVLLGVPSYEDADAGYHVPRVERLGNALAGINAALISREGKALKQPVGISVYAEWTTSEEEWTELREQFRTRSPQ